MNARILVVDDAITDREVVKAFLRQAGYDVVAEAGTGAEAIQAFERHRPDVVLMDLVMPEMSGTEAARAILSVHPDARIIAMSGLSQPSVQAEAMEAGMMAFVPKPLEADDLLSEVREALGFV
ncbi:MAG: response regulator [Deltaproteobacteria bacterium]|nr:response regulator [Deltaproteobacteria bacterium]